MSISSHHETEYLDFVLKDLTEEDENQEEMKNLFMLLLNRLRKMGGDLVRIDQTKEIHEMIEIVNEFKTVLFLHNLVLKD